MKPKPGFCKIISPLSFLLFGCPGRAKFPIEDSRRRAYESATSGQKAPVEQLNHDRLATWAWVVWFLQLVEPTPPPGAPPDDADENALLGAAQIISWLESPANRSSHLAFPLACRLMRDLCPIVVVLPRAVHDGRHRGTVGSGVAPDPGLSTTSGRRAPRPDDSAAFSEEILDLSETQDKAMVDPDGVTDDVSGKAVAATAGRLARQPSTLPPCGR